MITAVKCRLKGSEKLNELKSISFRVFYSSSIHRLRLVISPAIRAGRVAKHRGFPLCTRKQKGLGDGSQNLGYSYITENKRVVYSWLALGEKSRGEKMKGTSIMLLKTNGEKMSEIGLSTMLMKIRNIEAAFHYSNEKKWT